MSTAFIGLKFALPTFRAYGILKPIVVSVLRHLVPSIRHTLFWRYWLPKVMWYLDKVKDCELYCGYVNMTVAH